MKRKSGHMASANRLERYRRIALDVLRRELGPFVAKVDIREDDDHLGEPALFLVAHFDKTAPTELSGGFAQGQFALSRALEEVGETRFPYFQIRFPEGFSIPDDFFLKFRSGIKSKAAAGSEP